MSVTILFLTLHFSVRNVLNYEFKIFWAYHNCDVYCTTRYNLYTVAFYF